MGHRKYPPVVVLIPPVKFIRDGIPWPSPTRSSWIPTLYDKIGYDPVKRHPVIKPFTGKRDKIINVDRGVLLKKFEHHRSFFRLHFGF